MNSSSCIFCELLTSSASPYFIKKFSCGSLYLNFNKTYDGRVLYIYHNCVPDITGINEKDIPSVHKDLYNISKAIKLIFPEVKYIDIAALGCVVPHLHWHIIPRRETDANWGSPPWPHVKTAYTKAEAEKTVALFRESLGSR